MPNVVVLGSTTAGADGNVSAIPLPGGLGTMISGLGVFYPDRRPTQRVGIVPDVTVRPTLEGVANGQDELLAAAIRFIACDGVPNTIPTR
jgi:C-terminal processing protease CtpA/Prc